MKQKPFYQCEHCVYYTPYYNICEERIWKVNCGYCSYNKKCVKPSLRDCKNFKYLSKGNKVKQMKDEIKDYQKYLCDTLRRVEKSIKSFMLYLDKDKANLKLDKYLKDDI